MTQRTDSAYSALSRFWLRSVLLHSLSYIGIFSLFSGNLALAQEATPDAFIVPTSNDSPLPAVASQANSVPNRSSRWERLRQRLNSTPASARQQQIRPEVSTSRAPARTTRLKPKLNSEVTTRSLRRRASLEAVTPAPQMPVSQVRSVVKSQTQFPKLVQAQPTTSLDSDGAYIDPTDYKIGATSYQAPTSVVLSERSTGCKAVVRSGLSGSICGTTKARGTRIALRGNRSIKTVRLAASQASSWVRSSRVSAKSGVMPIQVGPLNVSSNGLRLISNPTTKRMVVAYNPASQPSGLLGNIKTKFLFPLTIPAPITSLFGWRIHPISGDPRFHSGTDLGAPLGTPVLAAEAGQVAIADYLGGYGLTVVLDHNKFTQQTLYGHLSEILVEPGEWVEQGTVIGRVGSTGNSTGPHLHFETRQLTSNGWIAVDPGVQLQESLAQLIEALKIAHSKGVNKV